MTLPSAIGLDNKEFNDTLHSMGIVRRGLYGVSAFVTNGVLGSVIVGSVGLIYAIFSDDGWVVGSILVGFLVYGIWLGLVCTLSGSISGLELVLAIVGIVIISALVIPEIYNKPSNDTAGSGDVVGSTVALALLASLVIIPKFEPYIQFQLKMVRLFAALAT